MFFQVSLMNNMTVHIFYFVIQDSSAMLVDAKVEFHAMLVVHQVYLVIYPINFLFLVKIVNRLGAIIPEPCQLWRVKHGADGDGVGGIILISELKDILAKGFDCLDNHFSPMIPYKVVVSCHDKYVHGFCVVRILNLERIKDCLKCGPRDGDVVRVHDVPLVMGEGGGGWIKELMECGV